MLFVLETFGIALVPPLSCTLADNCLTIRMLARGVNMVIVRTQKDSSRDCAQERQCVLPWDPFLMLVYLKDLVWPILRLATMSGAPSHQVNEA